MSDNNSSTGDGARGAMDQFTAHLDRGWDLIHRGDLRGAQLSAEKSLELDAQSPEAYNLLGYVRAAQGQADEALESYKQAIALDDTFVEAMLNAAEVLIHPLHDFDAAIGMVEEALDFAENDDDIADALLLKYDAYMHQGDKQGAARVVEGLPSGPFETARLDFLVGRANFETGHHDAALRLLERAVDQEPHNADAHYVLALIHEALNDSEAMASAFLRAREADLAAPPMYWAVTRNVFEGLVDSAIERLPAPLRAVLSDAQCVVAELPGPEVVADGIDPRIAVLLDTAARPGRAQRNPKVARMFVYQRNVERTQDGPDGLADEIYFGIEEELCATFPELARHATARETDELD